jgi:hypothetical protein
MHASSVLGLVVLALAMSTNALGKTARQELADAARAFDESALRLGDNNAKPAPVRKWMGAIRIAFDNPRAAPNLVELTRTAIKTDVAETGIAVIDLETGDKTANFVVYFDENGLNGQSGYCFGGAKWDKSSVIYRGELRINPARIMDIDRCAIHEPLHALGFSSHPHAAVSVLSYTYHSQRTLTPLDKNLIRTLYDSRLAPGTKPAPASQLACRILGERMGAAEADIGAVCRDRKGPTPSI